MSRSALITALIALLMGLPLWAQAPAPRRTALDGVFSQVQAERGEISYASSCGGCHGEALEGVSAPELTGARFIERWREAMLDSIYDFIRERMPPGRADPAAPLTDREYLDILAFVLETNGYNTGPDELTREALGEVMLVGMDGPQPVPDGSHVVTVGCLSDTPDGRWLLSRATEPRRTASPTSPTSEDTSQVRETGLSSLSFGLTGFGAVPDFTPREHRGHKVQAKGYLVRQPNAERIGLTAMEALDPSCDP